jgi:urate oxidase
MLTQTSYGKERVRLVQVLRRSDRHDLRDLTVAVRFEGDYDASYAEGDNSAVLPTDTMKNTVYALAGREPVQEPESFARRLAAHFLERNERLARVTIDIAEHLWHHLANAEREHAHAFSLRGPETRTAVVCAGRQAVSTSAGIAGLMVLKSAASAFSGFPRDELTTLPDTRDRLLATSLTATWQYLDADVEFGPAWHAVRATMLDRFAEHRSESVQHTLHAMGQAVLDEVDVVSSIRLVMPNRHHLPFDLTRFGLENRNEIFVATEEPYGLIAATLVRSLPDP